MFKLRDLPPKRDVQGGRASYSISEPLFIPPPGFISPPIKDLAYTAIGDLPDCTLSEAKAILRVYEEYCAQHPGSPAAVRHPRILVDHGLVRGLARTNH